MLFRSCSSAAFAISSTLVEAERTWFTTCTRDSAVELASAAEEQAGAIEQVTLGVDQISSVVQTNSATAEESAAASQELSEQASTLKSLVAKFKLREEYARMASQSEFNSYGTPSSNIIDLD